MKGTMGDMLEVNSRSKPGKAELRSIEVERSANGGFIASHRFMNGGSGPYKESEQHTFGPDEGGKMIDHIKGAMGVKADKDSAAGAAT